jgi:DNA-binding LytR/AlgR family response regulator
MMMRLVICDDDLTDLTDLENLLLKYSACHCGVNFEIDKFSDASLLLQNIQEEKPADLYILDIIMSEMTGIDLGREIRKNSQKSIIIYVSSSDDFAMNAYDIHAVRYLLKPIEESRFFEALDYALAQTAPLKRPVYLVKTKKGLESIAYSEIEYIESASRRLEIHLTDGTKITSIYIRKSFEVEIKEFLHSSDFICVHKSFLINLSQVRTINQNSVTMDSGVNIPVSRKNFLNLKKAYLSFISDQYKNG